MKQSLTSVQLLSCIRKNKDMIFVINREIVKVVRYGVKETLWLNYFLFYYDKQSMFFGINRKIVNAVMMYRV